MDVQQTPAIAVDRLVKRYKGVGAVDGISFKLAAGSVTGLLGGNGAGKTTTIAMIMGLVTPTSGAVRVLGAEMPRERYRVLHRMNFESPYVDMPMRLTQVGRCKWQSVGNCPEVTSKIAAAMSRRCLSIASRARSTRAFFASWSLGLP